MIPCSDYPPTENGESVKDSSVGRIEGGRAESDRRQGPSDLDASHPSSSSSPSLVEELMHIANGLARLATMQATASPQSGMLGYWDAAVLKQRNTLRSRLTALETELREAKQDARRLKDARDAWQGLSSHQSWCADCKAGIRTCPIGSRTLDEAIAANEAAFYPTFRATETPPVPPKRRSANPGSSPRTTEPL